MMRRIGSHLPIELAGRVLDLAVRIQQIPAPSFHEARRAALVRELFLSENLPDVSLDGLGNVYARIPGSGSALPVIISAHSDTVFPLETDLTIRRQPEQICGPGIGDNALGVAGLFGVLWMVSPGSNPPYPTERNGSGLPGDIWLVANACEEGLGDLRGIRAVVDRFGSQARAYLVLEGLGLGHVYHAGLAVCRYRVRFGTAGGHSWVDFGRPSAIYELADFIQRLTALELSESPRTTLNVGMVQGGTSINTIAAQACLELDLRSESETVLAQLSNRVEALVKSFNRPGVQVSMEIIGQRPFGGIPVHHPLVQLAMECLQGQGLPSNLAIGSTDANLPLSRGLPAVCLGLTNGGGAHTLEEYINIRPLPQGLEQLHRFLHNVWKI